MQRKNIASRVRRSLAGGDYRVEFISSRSFVVIATDTYIRLLLLYPAREWVTGEFCVVIITLEVLYFLPKFKRRLLPVIANSNCAAVLWRKIKFYF